VRCPARHKGGHHTLAALKSIRATRPDGAPIYVILDNLSANATPAIRTWWRRHKVKLCLTPTNASRANPIEAQFGPLRQFSIANSDYPTTRCWRGNCRQSAVTQRQQPAPDRAGRTTP
jgi:hypothetical protein